MYDWIMGTTLVLWLATFVGMVVRLPIFMNRRRWAVLAFVLVPAIGGNLAPLAATPKQKQQLAYEDAVLAADREAKKADRAGTAIELDSTWANRCDGECLYLSGTLTNTTAVNRKDPVVKCEFFGDSGSVIATRQEKIYKVVPAGRTVRFASLDMGLKPGQAAESRCRIVASKDAMR